MLSLNESAAMLASATVRGTGAVRFTGVSTDSRSIAAGDLFVALQGERFDGHEFLEAVARRGAVAALVSRPNEASAVALPCIVVPDTRRALGELARAWRQRFDIPVIAVTGSNGKTTTKEMVASILAAAYGETGRLATRGNFNNDIGLPLTVLRLRSSHRAAVVELGMNHAGETEWLAEIARPTIALITNAQREHQEFLRNVEAVAREHSLAIQALSESGIAVFPEDDAQAAIWRDAAGARKVIGFAMAPAHAAVTIHAHLEDRAVVVSLQTPEGAVMARIHAAGLHSARNAAAACAATLAAGIDPATIVRGLEAFAPVAGRMQFRQAEAGALLIDDSYNANPDSVRAAIDVLAASAPPRTLVLGDMGEVGEQGPQFHAEIGAYARARGIDALLALGNLTRHAVAACGPGARHFEDIDALAEAVRACAESGTVLIKGSRFMRMERIVQAIERPDANNGRHASNANSAHNSHTTRQEQEPH